MAPLYFQRPRSGAPLSFPLRRASDEAVADAEHRLYPAAAPAELRAQAAYVHVERARVAVVLLAPDFVEKLLARRDPPRPPRERREERELLAREAHFGAVAEDVHVFEVYAQSLVLVVRGGGVLRTPQHRADARDQFAHGEGLGDVVVRAQFQTCD